jgi:YesN/AraC family two-component response regulator
MPGMSGFQVLAEARTLYPDLRSILVTGHGTPEIMKEADTMGFDAILLKPFTSNELRGTVEQVLASKD